MAIWMTPPTQTNAALPGADDFDIFQDKQHVSFGRTDPGTRPRKGHLTEAVWNALAEKRPFDRADYLRRLAELPGDWPSPEELGRPGS